MQDIFVAVTVALVIIIVIPLYRVAAGPTVFDRLLGIGAMGAKTIALVCLFGFLYGRFDMFIDIAIAYGILNFIAGVAVAKYFVPPTYRQNK